jgi:hypothetical protein
MDRLKITLYGTFDDTPRYAIYYHHYVANRILDTFSWNIYILSINPPNKWKELTSWRIRMKN